jgi:hypothetical protein
MEMLEQQVEMLAKPPPDCKFWAEAALLLEA